MRIFLLVLISLVAAAVASPSQAAISVIDDSGARVTLTHPAQRIISVTPATTEMLFAIGDGPRVVGGTTSDDYPAAALKVARIGDWTPNYEKILSLRPDLVVVDDIAEHAAAVRLRSLRITVLVIRPATLSAVEADLRLIGRVTGSSRGAEVAVGVMEQKIKAAAAIAAADGKRPRVLAVIGHDPLFVAGAGTFIDDAIHRAGGVDVAANIHGYAQYSPEAVIANQPDFVLAGAEDAQAMTQVPAFRAVAAVRARRFVSIDPELFARPGPRLADGILELAKALHPGR